MASDSDLIRLKIFFFLTAKIIPVQNTGGTVPI